jgi:hypothetical protein
LKVNFNGSTGIVSRGNSFVLCYNSLVDGGNTGSFGAFCGEGSTLLAWGTQVSNVTAAGFECGSAGMIDATGCKVTHTTNGFYARSNSTIMAYNAVASQCTAGFQAEQRGFMVAVGSSGSGNVTDYIPAVNVVGGTGELIIK